MRSFSSILSFNTSLQILSQVDLNKTNDTSEDTKYDSQLTDWEDTIVGTYLFIICVLAFVLNALVIYTCIRNMQSLNISDFYILNLACSDILLPLTAFPLPILSSFFHRWMFEDIGCILYGFLGFFFGLVSITTLTIMGLTRYISICHPHIDISGRTFLRWTIIFPYVYALIWSCLPLGGWGSYSLEAYRTSCTLQWNENRAFITLMSVFCIFSPSVVIVFTYGLILVRCKSSNRKMRSWQRQNSKTQRKEAFLIKITFAMCWGFLLSWMPYAIVSMWTAYGDFRRLPIRLTVIAVLLAKTSTVINPIIYFLMSKKFRPLLLRSLNWSEGRDTSVIQELFPLKPTSSATSPNTCLSSSTSSFIGNKFFLQIKKLT